MKKILSLITLLALATSARSVVLYSESEVSVKDFGAVCDGVTDDTTAIQNAINYIVTHSGGVLYVPAGTNSITSLTIPQVSGGPNSVTLRIRGPVIPGQAMGLVESGAGRLNGGAVWKCTIFGSAGQGVLNAGPSSTFNPVTLDIENLTIQLAQDPIMIGLNARMAYSLRLRGVRVWTGTAPVDITSAPTHSSSVAVATPANNNAAFTDMRNVDVCGFWAGYELSEHASLDYSSAWKCEEAMTFPGANHGIRIGRVGDYHCAYGIGFTGFGSRFSIEQHAIERAPSGWAVRVADIYDPSNLGTGDVTWVSVLGNVGPAHVFTKVGGAKINDREIGAITSSSVVSGSTTIYAGGGSPSLTPTNSIALYINTNSASLYYWYNAAWH